MSSRRDAVPNELYTEASRFKSEDDGMNDECKNTPKPDWSSYLNEGKADAAFLAERPDIVEEGKREGD